MSFLTPTLRAKGPVMLDDKISFEFKEPTLTSRDFQILLVVTTVNISVSVLKQSRPKSATSKKN